MLTKEQIEAELVAREYGAREEGNETDLFYALLCRLALLGLESEERAERVGKAVQHWVADETPQSLRKDSERMAKRGLPAYALLLANIADAMEEP